jgi:RsiW-degrading membrane proteinase PrsW (M82 family)
MSAVPSRPTNDRLFIVLGIASVVLTIGLAVADALGLLPENIGALLVIAVAMVGIRSLFALRARTSSALSNPTVMNVVSLILLGVAVLTAVADIVVALRGHPVIDFFIDLEQHAWSLLLLLIVAIPARTMGWKSLLGMALTGLLAVSSLALFVGRFVVNSVTAYNQFAVAFYVPITEELLKAAPLAIFAILAFRNENSRPSAVDFGLLGYVCGMGFALIEDAAFGRIAGTWDSLPPLSTIFPSMHVTAGLVSQGERFAGHAIWTGFVGLGIGFGVLYWRRFRFAWIAIPLTLALSVIEHGIGNADLPTPVLGFLTADGTLVAILFPIGMIALAIFEHRPLTLRTLGDLRFGAWLTPASLEKQHEHLAALQRPRPRKVATVVATPTIATPETAAEVNS